jgi:hypothetical protein
VENSRGKHGKVWPPACQFFFFYFLIFQIVACSLQPGEMYDSHCSYSTVIMRVQLQYRSVILPNGA